MSPAANPAATPHAAEERHAALRQLGARAHQLRATVRGADHFSARDAVDDRDTGSWLMSSAVSLAADLAADIDVLARGLKEGPPDVALSQTVAALRVRVYQLHASARAADHFLDQDNREDHETGSWLIAAALGLATRLASELDDCAAPARRRGAEPELPAEPQRRVAATPLRGAA